MTMEITTKMAGHDTTLHTAPTLTPTSGLTSQLHSHIATLNGSDQKDVNQ